MFLFVYGTLKQGGKYHCYLGEAALVAEHATAKGTLYDSGMGYPAMALSEENEIQGEVYDIPEELWPAIDDLEGYTGGAAGDLFDKIEIAVDAAGETLNAIVYIAKDQALLKKKMATGVWDVRMPQEQV